MNPFDFNFIVLPLGGMIFLLVGVIMLVVKREEISKKRKIRRIEAVLNKKTKQSELMEKQLRDLDTMYSNKSIDPDTYERMRAIVTMNSEKQEETDAILRSIWEK